MNVEENSPQRHGERRIFLTKSPEELLKIDLLVNGVNRLMFIFSGSLRLCGG